MEMMNYKLAKAHIADLYAMRHAPKADWQGASLWEAVSGWWQAHTKKQAAPKATAIPADYRAELMRQEWMVADDHAPVNNVKC